MNQNNKKKYYILYAVGTIICFIYSVNVTTLDDHVLINIGKPFIFLDYRIFGDMTKIVSYVKSLIYIKIDILLLLLDLLILYLVFKVCFVIGKNIVLSIKSKFL